eukprot:5842012-Prymnesium_polylepis.5
MARHVSRPSLSDMISTARHSASSCAARERYANRGGSDGRQVGRTLTDGIRAASSRSCAPAG